MIYVATIENGVVAQVTVEADGYTPNENQAIVGAENVVGIGFTYDGATFKAPVVAETHDEE